MDRPRTAEVLDCVDLQLDVRRTIRNATVVNPNTQRRFELIPG
jgi:hypothetical protein